MNWLQTDAAKKAKKAKKAEEAIRQILQRSSDTHNIFTPFELCQEVVSKIPSLEGNILVVANLEFVYILLMNGVSSERIYFATPCTLKAQVAESKLPKSNIVVHRGMISEDNFKMKFDVVVGNPPYQNDKGSSTSNSSLWINFSIQATDFIENNGYVCFVTPQSWMKPNHKLHKIFKQNNLMCVNTKISDFFPGVGSTFSYWIFKKANNKEQFTDVDGISINFNEVPYLVSGDILSVHEKLVFSTDQKFKIDSDQRTAYTLKLTKKDPNLSKTQTEYCKYPIMHTNAQTIYSSTKTKNFDDKKVMFSDSGYFKPKYNSGGLGSSQRCYFILVNTDIEGQQLQNILQKKIYQFIVKTAKWSGFSDLTVLRSLPKVDLTRSWTDEELYKHFNLTEEEIKLIEDTIK